MPPVTSKTLPALSSCSAPGPLSLSMSSPDVLHSEFSRSLEQCFTWTPPDLTVSSQSGPSIVALSSSEVVNLGLSRFLDDSIASHLANAEQLLHQETKAEPCPCVANRIQPSHPQTSSGTRARIHGLDSEKLSLDDKDPSIAMSRPAHRRSMDRATSSDRVERFAYHSIARLPLACSELLSVDPSSMLFSSTFPHSLANGRKAFPSEGTAQEDHIHKFDGISHSRVSPSDNPSVKGVTGHEPCSCSDIRNDDTPSALDFHINTFPLSASGLDSQTSSSAVIGQNYLGASFPRPDMTSQRIRSISHTSESPSMSFLQSLATSETSSLSPTFSDRVDINRRFIHFPSPNFSLSHFPSAASSSIVGSSEATQSSGDGAAALPSNWGTRDIIIDLTPILDESANGSSIPESPKSGTPRSVHRKGVARKVAKLGGKLRRLFLQKVRSRGSQGKKPCNEASKDVECDHAVTCNSRVEIEGTSAPLTPPGLPERKQPKQAPSDLTQLLSPNVNILATGSGSSVGAGNETSTRQRARMLEEVTISPRDNVASVASPEPKSMKKRFSLSLFTRPSVGNGNDGWQQKRPRPKSMSDLSGRYPDGGAPGSAPMQNDSNATPIAPAPIGSCAAATNKINKRSKRLSLQALRGRF